MAGPDEPDKKDLTGINSMPPVTPSSSEGTLSAPSPETVDSFESIAPDLNLPSVPAETTPEPVADDPFAQPISTAPPPAPSVSESYDDLSSPDPGVSPPTADPLDDLRQYSQNVQGTSQLIQVFVPYHLYLSGTFGPFERDKLLLFITENDLGVSPQDLDLQIRSGKVFFPRISEYAGIKLVQELRDSGLQFRFVPAQRDADEVVQVSGGVEFHYQPEGTQAKPLSPIPVLPESAKQLADYVEIDSVQLSQYLKAEIVEAERSELFQEVLERMTESLKQKARLKGGDALANLRSTVTPLRLPSQYQVQVQATVLKRR